MRIVESPLDAAFRGDDARLAMIVSDLGEGARDLRDDGGRSLLHAAAAGGNASSVERLLAIGCDPGLRDGRGMTPLHWAAKDGCRTGPGTVVPLLPVSDRMAADRDGMLPLHWAMLCCRFQAIPLLGGAAEWNERTNDGTTALHLAAGMGPGGMLGLGVAAGADPGAMDASGSTPLHVAAMHCGGDELKMLLDAGADPMTLDANRMNSLARALLSWNMDAVEYLSGVVSEAESIRLAGGTDYLRELLSRSPPKAVADRAGSWLAGMEAAELSKCEGGHGAEGGGGGSV